MSRINDRFAFALFLTVAACGGSSREPAAPAPSSQPSSSAAPATTDLVPMCERIFARKATCADDYLPALLDVRVELNAPPGIAETIKSEGRDAVLATAHTELARDTQPDRVAAVCDEGASRAANAPPERVRQLLEQSKRCEAAADCKAFASCVVEIDRGFIAASMHK
jgi:hypothetical protein